MFLLCAGVNHFLDHFLVLAEVANQVLHPASLVLLVLAEQLLLVYQVILISPEPLNLLVDLIELMCLFLSLECDLVGLLLAGLLQLGQVRHQPVVLLLVEL